MLNRWSWVALGVGVGAYVAFTLAAFPAATAYRWFGREPVRLAGIEGTVWAGRAKLGSVADLPLSDIRWRVHAWPLVLGRVTADLEARLTDGFISGHVAATPSAVEVTQLKASTSLPTLRAVLPVQNMRGLASAELSRLRLVHGWPTAVVGRLRLADLQVPPLGQPTAQLVALGNYEITCDDDTPADGLSAMFHDTGGPLEVTGTLALDANRAYTLDSLIKPRSDASTMLVQGLAIMTAEPDAQGRRKLTLTGSL